MQTLRTDTAAKAKPNMSARPSVQLSTRTWPVREVQGQMGSRLISSEHQLRVPSGSQEDPGHKRAEEGALRTTPPLTTEALVARGESLNHLCRRVVASISRSACPASSSTLGSSEEEEGLRRRMDEYLLHPEYYKSVRGEDGEEPVPALGSRPRTDLGSCRYSGPSSDMAETASLPRRHEYPRACCPTPRAPEVRPTYIEETHHPGPTYGTLDRTAELLARLLYGSEDPNVTALSEAVKAKLGTTEPLPKPELSSASPGPSTLADDLKRSRVSRLLPKVTFPSPFHPRARTLPMAELRDDPVTETEKRRLTAPAPLAGRAPPPFRTNLRGWEEWQTNCPGKHPAKAAGV